jgi:hypothetical protein
MSHANKLQATASVSRFCKNYRQAGAGSLGELINRVGQNHIYSVHTVLLAWRSPNIRCIYTTYIYNSGQPY